MTKARAWGVLHNFLVAVALYPVALLGVWVLVALGEVAVNLQLPADAMPLVYGLVFAVLTLTLLDLLGVAASVLALVSCANLIEYAQIVVPGRSPSWVDFTAGLCGVVVAATLVWASRALITRRTRTQPEA